MASITSTLTAFFDLFGLPPELRLMIFELSKDEDLSKMRLSSRQLFRERNKEFEGNFLDEIIMVTTASKVERLYNLLRLPIMAQSKLKIRALDVRPPTLKNLTIMNDVLEDWLPSKRSVRRLLNAMPNLREFTLCAPDDTGEMQYHYDYDIMMDSQAIPKIFLSALGRLKPEASNLTCLTLDGIDFDGIHLLKVLCAHESSLTTVDFTSCGLTGAQKKPMTWKLMFVQLYDMDLDDVFLSSLFDPNKEEKLVLYERSQSDRVEHNWSSSNPLHRAPLARSNVSGHGEHDVNDPGAVFSRKAAHLKRSWVEKGLEILLGLKDHTLYHGSRNPDDIPRRQ